MAQYRLESSNNYVEHSETAVDEAAKVYHKKGPLFPWRARRIQVFHQEAQVWAALAAVAAQLETSAG